MMEPSARFGEYFKVPNDLLNTNKETVAKIIRGLYISGS